MMAKKYEIFFESGEKPEGQREHYAYAESFEEAKELLASRWLVGKLDANDEEWSGLGTSVCSDEEIQDTLNFIASRTETTLKEKGFVYLLFVDANTRYGVRILD